MVFTPTIVLFVSLLVMVVGFATAFTAAPHAIAMQFELTPRDSQERFNVSESFWGTGSLTAAWFGLEGPNATISVLGCGDANCSAGTISVIYSSSADFGYHYARGISFHTYELKSTGLMYHEYGNLSLDFNWSVLPLVGAWDEIELIGLGIGFGGGCYPIALVIRGIRS